MTNALNFCYLLAECTYDLENFNLLDHGVDRLKSYDSRELEALILFIHRLHYQAKGLTILEELHQWKDLFSTCCSNQNKLLSIIFKNFSNLAFNIKEITPSKQSLSKKCLDFNEVKEKCSNCSELLKEKQALQVLLNKEKDTHNLLNSTIEDIEQDLSNVFSQKNKLMKIMLEISKILCCIKNIDFQSESFSGLELNFETISEDCLCEMCVNQESDELTHSSDKITVQCLAEWIKSAVSKGSLLESKITESIENYSNAKSATSLLPYTEELQNQMQELHYERDELKLDISKLNKEIDSFVALIGSKDLIIANLETEKIENNKFFNQCQEKLKACEEQISKLSLFRDTLKQEIACCEEKIQILQKTNDDRGNIIDKNNQQCKEYETQISNLKKLALENEERNSQVSSFNKEVVTELENKVDCLLRTNTDLNMEIVNCKKEIQNISNEKLNLENSVDSLVFEKDKLEKDISEWKEMYEMEKKLVSELKCEMNLKNRKSVSLDEIERIKNLHDSMEKDVTVLKNLQRQHEDTLLAKNRSLKEKDKIIQNLSDQIEKAEIKNAEFNDLIDKFEEIKCQCKQKDECLAKLEDEIVELKSAIDVENKQIQQINEKEQEKKEMENQVKTLKLELEKRNQEIELQKTKNCDLFKDLENTKNALKEEIDLRSSMENELCFKIKKITQLNESLKKNLGEIENMKKHLSSVEENNKKLEENESLMKKQISDLKKEIHIYTLSLKKLETKCSNQSKENFPKISNPPLENQTTNNLPCLSSFEKLKHSFSTYKKLAQNTLDIVAKVLSKNSSFSVFEKLMSDIKNIQIIINSNDIEVSQKLNFPNDFLENLNLFLEFILENTDEELKIYSLTSSIGDTICYIGQFIESLSNNDLTESISPKLQRFLNNTLGITLNETCLLSTLENKTDRSHVCKELQHNEELLRQHFFKLKDIIQKQTDESKDLKFKLDQISASSSFKPEVETVPKWKFTLVKTNYQRSVQEANKIKQMYAALKKELDELSQKISESEDKISFLQEEKSRTEAELLSRITILEEENKKLDNEAEEIADEYKKLEDFRAEEHLELIRLEKKLEATEEELKNLKAL